MYTGKKKKKKNGSGRQGGWLECPIMKFQIGRRSCGISPEKSLQYKQLKKNVVLKCFLMKIRLIKYLIPTIYYQSEQLKGMRGQIWRYAY